MLKDKTVVEPSKTERTETQQPEEITSFITPEMIENTPILATAGMFANDPYWKELMVEIKKERAKQRRRERRRLK
jgi:hypothetical protein